MHAKVDPKGAYNKSQKINLLCMAVSSADNLAIVHSVELTTRKAARITDAWLYEDYAAAVTAAAEMYDSKNPKKDPITGISANIREFGIGEENQIPTLANREANIHDFNTPADELLASRHSRRTPITRRREQVD